MNATHTFRRIHWPKIQPQTTIVVPVMNEADNILPLIERIAAVVAGPQLNGRRVEVLFVDDSKDSRSVQNVMFARIAHRTKNFDVRIYHRLGAKNWGGLSGAVADGMRMAQADQIIVMDGDLQHPPETIPSMILEAAKGNDLVVASRYRKGGSASGLDGGIRHLVSRGSTLLAKTLFPVRLSKITDPMTGFFLIDRRQVDRSRLRPKGFKILLELAATHKLRVAEVPLQFAERTAGESHGDLKQGIEFFKQLAILRFGQVLRAIDQLPKFVKFGAIGGSVFVFGLALLHVLVTNAGWPLLLANAVQLVVTFWLNYVLNKRITWRERTISRSAASKFLISRAATTALNFFMFAWLVNLNYNFVFYGQAVELSVNYIVANIITLIAMMALNYEISDRWAFAEPKKAKAAKVRKARSRLKQANDANSPYTSADTKGQLPIGASLGGLFVVAAIVSIFLVPTAALSIILAVAGLALFAQASLEAWRMMYAYRVPEAVDKLKFPEPIPAEQGGPQEKFCIIVPARHESAVLASTLRQLAKQTHPNVEIITVICDDDTDTLAVAYDAASYLPRVSVMEYPLAEGVKPSKPLQLNYVLEQTSGHGYTVVGIVDAEDSVHPELLTRIDAAFADREIGVVQGGVQLMNHDTSWYSLHNVLEYYRWFNSAMAFQSDANFMPLGGNTIFVRDSLLRKAGGWPVTLTEDCSLGVLLSSRFRNTEAGGAKTAVYYDSTFATQEETPDTIKALFKQRVRWFQGFFHEWRRGIWAELPSFKQRVLAAYILLGPVMLAVVSLFMVASLIAVLFLSAPVALVMIMYLPLLPVTLLSVINGIALHDFGKAFQRKVTFKQYLVLFLTQPFYQILLNAAAFWSVIRELRGNQTWYKTEHSGLHRGMETTYGYANAIAEPAGVGYTGK